MIMDKHDMPYVINLYSFDASFDFLCAGVSARAARLELAEGGEVSDKLKARLMYHLEVLESVGRQMLAQQPELIRPFITKLGKEQHATDEEIEEMVIATKKNSGCWDEVRQ